MADFKLRQMLSEYRSLIITFSTEFTLERLLPPMPSHMNNQIIIPNKPLSALGTQKLLGVIIMELHMLGKMRLGQKRLLARLAPETLLPRVPLHVDVAILLRREPFQTDRALIFLFSHDFLTYVVFRGLVLGEVIGPSKRPLADVAFVFLYPRVQLHVLREVISPREALRADFAVVGLAFEMRRHVPFEMVRAQEFFVADTTDVDLDVVSSAGMSVQDAFFFEDFFARGAWEFAQFFCLDFQFFGFEAERRTTAGSAGWFRYVVFAWSATASFYFGF